MVGLFWKSSVVGMTLIYAVMIIIIIKHLVFARYFMCINI